MARLRLGILAPRVVPRWLRNTDLRQGTALLGLGEFSSRPLDVVPIPSLAWTAGVLGVHAVARGLLAAADRLRSDALARQGESLVGLCAVVPATLPRVDALYGHGLLARRIAPGRLPPQIWNPGYTPDDYCVARGIDAGRRRHLDDLLRRRAPLVEAVALPAPISVRLWNERIGVPRPERVWELPLFTPHLPRAREATASTSRSRDVGGERAFEILFVGGEARRKNLPAVIEATGRLHATGVRVSLSVVSDLRDGPIDLSPPFVRHLGPQPLARVQALMRTADVLCVPSNAESYGLVYVEALAHGCPVVAPDREMQRDLLEDAALFADPTSVDEIAAALEKVRTPSVRSELVERGLELYRRRFAPDVVADAYAAAAERLRS